MTKMIFLNLPVRDLPAATAFYEAVGAKKDLRFCDDTASCMVFSDAIYVMLLTHEKFAQFTTKAIADARSTAQMLVCLSADSREAVDTAIDTAVAAGGAPDPGPLLDYGFMYSRSYEDLDGHIFEILWMDEEAAVAAMQPEAAAAV